MKQLYIVQCKYWMPVAGGAQLFAESKEEVTRILSEAHKDMRDFAIVDVSSLDEIEAKQAEMLKQAYPNPETAETEEVAQKEDTVH